jgi:uncharacterized protein (DUF1810 family)
MIEGGCWFTCAVDAELFLPSSAHTWDAFLLTRIASLRPAPQSKKSSSSSVEKYHAFSAKTVVFGRICVISENEKEMEIKFCIGWRGLAIAVPRE